jgi:hypothetical protein
VGASGPNKTFWLANVSDVRVRLFQARAKAHIRSTLGDLKENSPEMSRNKRAVRILNPASGSGWTSARRANDYVRQKRARWVRGGIEFIAADPRHMVVQVSAENDYDRAVRTGLAPIEAIRHLPVVGRVEVLLTRTTRRAA